MTVFFQSVLAWYMAHINYGTIVVLMAIESSFIPFPSEIVIPPAAYKAALGDMNIFLVILAGSAGALIGALFNYYFALILGRKLIYSFANTRFANFLLVNREGIEKSEKYFITHGRSSTLIGRFIPGIRQLISLPAGLAKMNLKDFVIFTFIGSTLWNVVLALLGYFFYSQKELLEKYYHQISIVMLILGVLFILYLVYNGFIKKNKK